MWKSVFALIGGLGLAAGADAAQPPNSLEADGFRGPIYTPSAPAPQAGAGPGNADGQPAFVWVPTGEDGAAQDLDEMTNPKQGPWHAWVSAETLIGTTRGVNVPPAITTGSAAPGIPNAATVGQPGTLPLFGGRRMLDDWRAGFRTELGLWLDNDHRWAVFGRFYSLFSVSDQFVGGGGATIVNVPQVVPNSGFGSQTPIYVTFPGVTTGSASATVQTTFTGGDISVKRGFRTADDLFRFEVFGGYRQLYLGDDLGIGFRAATVGSNPITAPFIVGSDNLHTRNDFYGGQLGGWGSVLLGRWTVQGLASAAIGVTASDLELTRARVLSLAGSTPLPVVASTTGGRVDYFGFVAEGGARVTFRVTERARLMAGYTMMYWPNVRRAPQQFTLGPVLSGGTTDFITHIVTIGADFRF